MASQDLYAIGLEGCLPASGSMGNDPRLVLVFTYFMVICGISLKYSTMALRVSRLNLMNRLLGHRSSVKSSSVLAKGQK